MKYEKLDRIERKKAELRKIMPLHNYEANMRKIEAGDLKTVREVLNNYFRGEDHSHVYNLGTYVVRRLATLKQNNQLDGDKETTALNLIQMIAKGEYTSESEDTKRIQAIYALRVLKQDFKRPADEITSLADKFNKRTERVSKLEDKLIKKLVA